MFCHGGSRKDCIESGKLELDGQAGKKPAAEYSQEAARCQVQSNYAAAKAVLERIPPDIIKAYTQRGNRERKVDQYIARE